MVKEKNKGFTLVELSIVIVIIGLIVAGVVAGQSIVNQAKLRQVLTQMEKIKTAINAYRLEYDALPGDHANATDFWGTAASCTASTLGSTNTCNGDGSKKLAISVSGDSSPMWRSESWHFWKHLENADLIEGTFTGDSDGTKCPSPNQCMEPGINTPAGPFTGSGWYAFSAATISAGSIRSGLGRANSQNRNILAFTNPITSPGVTGTWNTSAVSLTVKQQHSIDLKIDDGMPYKGRVVDWSGSNANDSPNCATINSNEFQNNPPGTTSVNALYNFSYEGIACMMLVDMD